jgi:hypothetical protein
MDQWTVWGKGTLVQGEGSIPSTMTKDHPLQRHTEAAGFRAGSGQRACPNKPTYRGPTRAAHTEDLLTLANDIDEAPEKGIAAQDDSQCTKLLDKHGTPGCTQRVRE